MKLIPVDVGELQKLQSLQIQQHESAGWQVDFDSVFDVKKQMGLRFPMVIVVTTRTTVTRGIHYVRGTKGNWFHRIVISARVSLFQANKTLLHELAHGQQFEHFMRKFPDETPKGFDTLYRSHGYSGRRYTENPFEVQANKFADENCESVQLIKEV
jgi:hypothetical protein